MALKEPDLWVPAHEAMKRLGLTDRRALGRMIASGRVRARWQGRSRQFAIGAECDPAPAASRAPESPVPPAAELPASGLSHEEASILAEPVGSAAGALGDGAGDLRDFDPRRGRRRAPTAGLAHLDRDMRRLRDRVETIAESIERLSTVAAGSAEKRLVVEATVIPPDRAFSSASASASAGAGPSHRTDPFSELRARPSPEPDYRPDASGRGARFARLLVALAIVAFSFLTGTLILAFV